MYAKGSYQIGKDEKRGSFLQMEKASSHFYIQHQFQSSIAVSFALRMPDKWSEDEVFAFIAEGNAIYFALGYTKISFYIRLKDTRNKITQHAMEIPLKGNARESFDYYFDQNWHHFVLQFNQQNGQLELWIDGACPDGFSKSVAAKGILCGKIPCPTRVGINGFHNKEKKSYFTGSMDDLAIYNQALSASSIRRQAASYSTTRPRQLSASPSSPQSPASQAKTYESAQYPLNYPRNVRPALDQLRNYPLPRFKQGHSLNRLFWWMTPTYLGGRGMEGKTQADITRTACLIQEELALNWNYYISLGNVLAASSERFLHEKDGHLKGFIDLANKYPDIPLAANTFWAQSRGSAIGLPNHLATVRLQDFPPSYYVRGKQNQFVDVSGRTSKGRKILSVAAPSSAFEADGKVQKKWLGNIVAELNRPINLINENGEVPPVYMPEKSIQFDRTIQQAMSKAGESDWETYQAKMKTRLRNQYSDQFMKGIPQLKDTRFSYYAVDGGIQHRFKWEIARKAATPFNGQYYSTPDFYPRWPDNWNSIRGAWRGWEWIRQSRPTEIRTGDKLYSPFIAAGWDRVPENNIRPGQWLGLLKCLSVTGAEFYYVGMFILKKPYAKPENYVWQAAIPAYAQAISSYYEPVLRDGNLLTNKQGEPLIDLPTGDPRVLVCARKHEKKPLYIISGTIQPKSNLVGTTPEKKDVQINLGSRQLSFEVRRQGSTYLYDLSEPGKPVFIQLDSWHENKHPEQWSENFLLEAELPVSNPYNYALMTRQAKNADQGDYTQFTTYISLVRKKKPSPLTYSFQTRTNRSTEYNIWVRARTSGPNALLCMYTEQDKKGKFAKVDSKEWKWFKLEKSAEYSLKNLKAGAHLLYMETHDHPVEVDQIIISASKRFPDTSCWE